MSNAVHIINIPYLHGLELITNTSQVVGYPTFLSDGSDAAETLRRQLHSSIVSSRQVGCHSLYYEDYCLLGCHTMKYGRFAKVSEKPNV
jgi:hypothetical protein